ncbi:BLUF domain-containing protein [uncultured Aquimarina sp.]|uniref:BLUF domain-containing protein n=1 Tax=uncultured Aquimarina sp. TaxID=575652 RepID=UPI00260C3126|nr:BLUF domain-containing protein [uncultured Aquimarina sp.]
MQTTEEIRTISYLSNSSKLDSEEIEELLIDTMTNNNKIGIGGILIYSNDTFFQIIEGYTKDIDRLFAKIELDKRHFNVFKIFDRKVSIKKFERFSFSYIRVEDEKISNELMSFLEIGDNFGDETHEMLVGKVKNLIKDSK